MDPSLPSSGPPPSDPLSSSAALDPSAAAGTPSAAAATTQTIELSLNENEPVELILVALTHGDLAQLQELGGGTSDQLGPQVSEETVGALKPLIDRGSTSEPGEITCDWGTFDGGSKVRQNETFTSISERLFEFTVTRTDKNGNEVKVVIRQVISTGVYDSTTGLEKDFVRSPGESEKLCQKNIRESRATINTLTEQINSGELAGEELTQAQARLKTEKRTLAGRTETLARYSAKPPSGEKRAEFLLKHIANRARNAPTDKKTIKAFRESGNYGAKVYTHDQTSSAGEVKIDVYRKSKNYVRGKEGGGNLLQGSDKSYISESQTIASIASQALGPKGEPPLFTAAFDTSPRALAQMSGKDLKSKTQGNEQEFCDALVNDASILSERAAGVSAELETFFDEKDYNQEAMDQAVDVRMAQVGRASKAKAKLNKARVDAARTTEKGKALSKKQEEKLAAGRKEFESAMKALGEPIDGVEIPLSHVLEYAEIGSRYNDLTGQVQDCATVVNRLKSNATLSDDDKELLEGAQSESNSSLTTAGALFDQYNALGKTEGAVDKHVGKQMSKVGKNVHKTVTSLSTPDAPPKEPPKSFIAKKLAAVKQMFSKTKLSSAEQLQSTLENIGKEQAILHKLLDGEIADQEKIIDLRLKKDGVRSYSRPEEAARELTSQLNDPSTTIGKLQEAVESLEAEKYRLLGKDGVAERVLPKGTEGTKEDLQKELMEECIPAHVGLLRANREATLANQVIGDPQTGGDVDLLEEFAGNLKAALDAVKELTSNPTKAPLTKNLQAPALPAPQAKEKPGDIELEDLTAPLSTPEDERKPLEVLKSMEALSKKAKATHSAGQAKVNLYPTPESREALTRKSVAKGVEPKATSESKNLSPEAVAELTEFLKDELGKMVEDGSELTAESLQQKSIGRAEQEAEKSLTELETFLATEAPKNTNKGKQERAARIVTAEGLLEAAKGSFLDTTDSTSAVVTPVASGTEGEVAPPTEGKSSTPEQQKKAGKLLANLTKKALDSLVGTENPSKEDVSNALQGQVDTQKGNPPLSEVEEEWTSVAIAALAEQAFDVFDKRLQDIESTPISTLPIPTFPPEIIRGALAKVVDDLEADPSKSAENVAKETLQPLRDEIKTTTGELATSAVEQYTRDLEKTKKKPAPPSITDTTLEFAETQVNKFVQSRGMGASFSAQERETVKTEVQTRYKEALKEGTDFSTPEARKKFVEESSQACIKAAMPGWQAEGDLVRRKGSFEVLVKMEFLALLDDSALSPEEKLALGRLLNETDVEREFGTSAKVDRATNALLKDLQKEYADAVKVETETSGKLEKLEPHLKKLETQKDTLPTTENETEFEKVAQQVKELKAKKTKALAEKEAALKKQTQLSDLLKEPLQKALNTALAEAYMSQGSTTLSASKIAELNKDLQAKFPDAPIGLIMKKLFP